MTRAFDAAALPLAALSMEAALSADLDERDIVPKPPQEQITIGLIDSCSFTRECLARTLIMLDRDLTVRGFVALDDCIAHADDALDLLVCYSHDEAAAVAHLPADIATLRAAFPDLPIVILSDAADVGDPDLIHSMFSAGARGFVPTRIVGIPLACAALRFVHVGGTFVPAALLLDARPAPPRPAPEDPAAQEDFMSPRQRDVFSHLRQGKANKVIAYELGVSESTVKVHIRNIMRKIGATNRTQAVYKAQALESVAFR